MKSAAILLALSLAACKPTIVVPGQPAPPSALDRVLDVSKALFCSFSKPPEILPEGPTLTPLITGAWTLLQAVVCAPPKPEEPLVEVGVEVAPVPVP